MNECGTHLTSQRRGIHHGHVIGASVQRGFIGRQCQPSNQETRAFQNPCRLKLNVSAHTAQLVFGHEDHICGHQSNEEEEEEEDEGESGEG